MAHRKPNTYEPAPPKKGLHRFYFDENNTGGYTVALGVLYNRERPHYVWVDAPDVDAAIHAFEAHFDVKWNEQNTYEGGSCSCCGRRFTVYAPEDSPPSDYDRWDCVATYRAGEVPYFVDFSKPPRPPTDEEKAALPYSTRILSGDAWGCALADAPKKDPSR